MESTLLSLWILHSSTNFIQVPIEAEDRKDLTAPVKPLVDNGYVVACVGYEYATGGQLLACVKQAAKALQVILKILS